MKTDYSFLFILFCQFIIYAFISGRLSHIFRLGLPFGIIPINSVSASCENVLSRRGAPVGCGGGVSPWLWLCHPHWLKALRATGVNGWAEERMREREECVCPGLKRAEGLRTLQAGNWLQVWVIQQLPASIRASGGSAASALFPPLITSLLQRRMTNWLPVCSHCFAHRPFAALRLFTLKIFY